MKKIIYFALNFPHNFIEQVWGEETAIGKHLRSKFNGYYSETNTYGVFVKFFVNLDGENQQILTDWIENYKG